MKIKSNHFKRQFDLHKAQLIGEGNFAQVYRIFDSESKDSIAIRKVKKSLADIEDINKQKHINEELRKVDNENILKIYDIIDQSEAVWYITEYCSGGSLWDALNLCKDNKMTEKQALQCILQISKGVQELHNHRITHRDLKPENILLKTKYAAGKPLPLIKLADFGLSTQKIIMETIAGTKEYIAPEQAKFHNYTNAVDVWSLGIIFDQILHGTPFYSGEDNKEVFNKILKMPFKIRDQGIRTSIKELLVSLLKKKPYQRPIIAVIRSTVQKILDQIDYQLNSRVQSQSERNKKSKSNNQTGQSGDFSKNSSEAKLNQMNSSKDNGNAVYSRKVYESGAVEREEQKFQKTWKSNLAQELTPQGRHKPQKQQLNYFAKNQSTGPPKVQEKQETKERIVSINYRQKVDRIHNKNKSIVDEIFPSGKREDKNVREDKVQQREQKSNPKQQLTVKVNVTPPINDKVSIYKTDKKKMIISSSSIKREEFKHQVVDLQTYKQRVFNSKKALADKNFKVEKITAFLPNTQLTTSDFQPTKESSEEVLSSFKKKMNYLNYFNEGDDYEIRLGKGTDQLPQWRQGCLKEFQLVQEGIKRVFLQQIDSYVEQYVDKLLR